MNTLVQMPGYQISEYRLVIPIEETLREKVSNLRKDLHEKFKVKLPFELEPGLTVLKCHVLDKNEPRLLERLQDVAFSNRPFKVEIKDFSAYPSHTIYLSIATKSPFTELVKGLKRIKGLMDIHEHEPQYIPEPHLIIAQKLKPMAFINMWMECEHKQFTGRFMANEMLLLKRNADNKQYETVRSMQFLSLPMNVKQGELFV